MLRRPPKNSGELDTLPRAPRVLVLNWWHWKLHGDLLSVGRRLNPSNRFGTRAPMYAAGVELHSPYSF